MQCLCYSCFKSVFKYYHIINQINTMSKGALAMAVLVFGLFSMTVVANKIALTPKESCLVGNEFEAKIKGFSAIFAGHFLFVWGCEGYHVYNIQKGSLHREEKASEIMFRQNTTSRLCEQIYSGVVTESLQSITNYLITIEGGTQRINLRNANDQLVAFLVSTQDGAYKIQPAALKGQYTLYISPVILSFSQTGRILIEACETMSGSYDLFSDGGVLFHNFSRSSCSNSQNLIAEHIIGSQKISFTNAQKCEFLLAQTSHNRYEVIVQKRRQKLPQLSLVGYYTLYLIGSDSDYVTVNVTDDRFNFKSCSSNSMRYTIHSINEIRFTDFKSEKISQCDTLSDNEHLLKFLKVTQFEFASGTSELRLLGNDSQIPIYSTDYEEFVSQLPKPSLVGEYALYLIGSDLEPIGVNVSESSFRFSGCKIIDMRYALQAKPSPTSENRILFDDPTYADDQQCLSNHDSEHVQQLSSITRFEFSQQTKQLRLYNNESWTPIYSTQLVEFLFEKPSLSLAGKYTLYLIDSDFGHITVTVTDDKFSFHSCSANEMKYAIKQKNQIHLFDFRSSKIAECDAHTDNEHLVQLTKVTRFELDDDANKLRLFGNDPQTPIYSSEANDIIKIKLIGNYTLYQIGSDLGPIEVTVTENLFIIKGCQQINMTYTFTVDAMALMTNIYAKKSQCINSSDNQNTLKFTQVVRSEFQSQNRYLRLFGNSTQLLYSTEYRQYLFNTPKNSIVGSFTLYHNDPDLHSINATFSDTQIFFIGCSQVRMHYSIGPNNMIKFANIEFRKVCQIEKDHRYILKFLKVTQFEFASGTSELRLLGNDSQIPIYSTDYEEFVSQLPKPSLVGEYALYLIGSDLEPIGVNVSESSFRFSGCKIIDMRYALQAKPSPTSENRILFDDPTYADDQQCLSNHDSEHVQQLSSITRFEFSQQTKQLRLYNNESWTPIYSTQLVEFLFEKPSLSLAGKYTLYLIDSDFGHITVTVTDDKFSFHSCSANEMKYAIKQKNQIHLFDFRSSKIAECDAHTDNEHLVQLTKVTRFELDDDANKLRLFGNDPQTPIYSSEANDIIKFMPQITLVGNYTLYQIGSDLKPMKVTVTSSSFRFSGCKLIDMRYTLLSKYYLASRNQIRFDDPTYADGQQCQSNHDSEHVQQLSSVTRFELSQQNKYLRLYNSESQTPIFSTQYIEFLFAKPSQSLAGKYKLYLIGSKLDVTVTVTDYRFSFQGCSTNDMRYAITQKNEIHFTDFRSSKIAQCKTSSDHEHQIEFAKVTSFQFNDATKKLKLFGSDSQNSIYTTDYQQFLSFFPKPSLAGNYTLYLIDLDLDPIRVAITDHLFIIEGCQQINITYVIASPTAILFTSPSLSLSLVCWHSFDNEYVSQFRRATLFEFIKDRNLLRLFATDSKKLIVSSERKDKFQNRLIKSLVGQYTLYPIGTGLDPITVTVTKIGFSFQGCRQISIDYGLTTDNDPKTYDLITFLGKQEETSTECRFNYDNEYVRKFSEIRILDFHEDPLQLTLYNDYQQTPVFSTQAAEYLLKKPKYSIDGSYKLYLLGSRLPPINVTATSDRLSFQGCGLVSMHYTIKAHREVRFTDFSSTDVQRCKDSSDSSRIVEFSSVIGLQFDEFSKELKLFGANSEEPTHSTQYSQYVAKRPQISLIGKYTLYLIGSDLDPITVTVTENRCSFKGCRQIVMAYGISTQNHAITFNFVSSSALFSRNFNLCRFNYDFEYVRRFFMSTSFKLNQETRQLRLFTGNHKNLIYSTQEQQYYDKIQRYSIYGSYKLYLIGSRLSPIDTTVTSDRLSFIGCGLISMNYTIKARKQIKFTRFSLTSEKNCEDSSDSSHIVKFSEVSRLQIDQISKKLRLFSENSEEPIYSTQYSQYVAKRPIISLIGQYTLHPIGSDLDPITVTITENSFRFQGCRQIVMHYVLALSNNEKEFDLIRLSSFASKGSAQCRFNYDSEYVRKFSEIRILDFHEDPLQLTLYNDYQQTPVFSTQAAEYLLKKPKYSIDGSYKLYLLGSRLPPINVTATSDRLSFQGCGLVSMHYTIKAHREVRFTDFSSTDVQRCKDSSDSSRIVEFSSVIGLQFDEFSKELKLFGANSEEPTHSTQYSQYVAKRPQISLIGKYTMYLIDASLPPLTVTVTENKFIFETCRKADFTYIVKALKIQLSVMSETNSCQFDDQNKLVPALNRITQFSFDETTRILRLIDKDSRQLLYSARPEVERAIFSDQSIIGNYTLYIIGSDLDPVATNVTENRLTFKGCKKISIDYAITLADTPTASNLISFSSTWSKDSTKCRFNYDSEYVRKFSEIRILDFHEDPLQLTLYNDYQQTPVFSTQAAEYLLKKPKYSIDGSYKLYLLGSRLPPINVTATSDRLSFQGCGLVSMHYTIKAHREVRFTDFSSTDVQRCKDSSDSSRIVEFSSVIGLQFDEFSKELKLFGANSEEPTHSTQYSQYVAKRPQISLIGKYTLYLIGSDLDPITFTVTENRCSFKGCRQIVMNYTITLSENNSAFNLINFFSITSGDLTQCRKNNDPEYTSKFYGIVKFDFDDKTRVLRLFNDHQQNPVFSTQKVDYLLNKKYETY